MLTLHARGVAVPALIYGTAWKEERTRALTRLALDLGFRGIDTANQRKHYVEAAVGEAVGELIGEGRCTRAELFLQTKFTYARGQDQRLPYDPDADVATQVRQSFALSLTHLGTTYVDAYLLHGPWQAHGIAAQDRSVWRTFEDLHRSGAVRLLGVSNIGREQLETLHREAKIKPTLVQNRCYARTGWDREVREFCRAHGILYQGFSLLTANTRELARPEVLAIAQRLGRSVPEVVFRMAFDLGMVALTGTSDPAHMRCDLDVGGVALTLSELATLEAIGG